MFKLLHIIAVFFAVGLTLGPDILVFRIIRSGDVRLIRSGLKVAMPLGKIGPPFFMIGAIMGLISAYVGSYNFLAPWLIVSYLIFITMVILGAAFQGPWLKRIMTAAMASPEDQMSPALQEAIATPKGGQLIFYFAPIAILTFIVLMVTKPLN